MKIRRKNELSNYLCKKNITEKLSNIYHRYVYLQIGIVIDNKINYSKIFNNY